MTARHTYRSSFAVADAAVDRESGVIRGVSVITAGVVEGHGILADSTTLEQVRSCLDAFGAGGCKVKVNHYSGFDAIVGALRNPRIEGRQLKADLHLIRSHPMFDTIVELAETMPSQFGLSIAFSGSVEDVGGLPYARCVELYSVDLVDDPAANPSGLFSVDSPKETEMEIIEAIKSTFGVKAETLAQLEQFKTDNTKLTAELATAVESITTLEAKVKALDSELSAARTAVEEFNSKVEAAASRRALEITAAQGQPPIDNPPSANPGKVEDQKPQLFGLAKVEAHFRAQSDKKK